MEINNLLTNLKKTQSNTKKFLAVEIGPDSVKSAVWEVLGTKPNLVQSGTLEQTNSNDGDELLQAIDISITKASSDVKPEPNEVVFSLPENWLDEEDISPDKKIILKHVSQKLALKPVGYVVTSEALIHYLQHKQGQPINAILLGITTDEAIVSLVTNGELQGTQFVGRSDDIGADVEEGIARFGEIKTLPSSITLYDGHTNLEEIKQVLMDYDWQDRLPFLHIPKITSLDRDESIKAVVHTGGAEVIKGLEIGSADTSEQAEVEPETEPEEIPDKSEEFGFTITEPTAVQEDEEPDEAEDLESQLAPEDDNVSPAGGLEDIIEANQEDEFVSTAPRPKVSLLARIKFNPFKRKGPTIGRRRSFLPLLLIFGLLIIGLVFAGLGAAYWYVPTATVTVYVQPQTIQKEISLTIDPNITDVNLESQSIPGVIRQTTVESSATTDSTGSNLVGDRASGEVTIYNRTSSAKTFESGTVLTGPDKLKYTINDDVSVASASTKENPDDLSITTEPSTASVIITAQAIGANYNMGNGTDFTIESFDTSSFVAKSSGDISGGSSREITAVAQADLDELSSQVLTELEDKILNQVNQNPDDFIGVVVLPDQEDNLTEEFSADVGDEADSVTLDASLSVDTMTYKKSDLNKVIMQLAESAIPTGYSLQDSESDIQVLEIDTSEEGLITVTANATAKVIPTLDANQIAATVVGKFPTVTEDYFKGLPGFSKVEIDIQPPLPPRIKTFPRIEANISVEIKSKD